MRRKIHNREYYRRYLDAIKAALIIGKHSTAYQGAQEEASLWFLAATTNWS